MRQHLAAGQGRITAVGLNLILLGFVQSATGGIVKKARRGGGRTQVIFGREEATTNHKKLLEIVLSDDLVEKSLDLLTVCSVGLVLGIGDHGVELILGGHSLHGRGLDGHPALVGAAQLHHHI